MAMLMLVGIGNTNNSYASGTEKIEMSVVRPGRHVINDISWTTVAESQNGFGKNVTISADAALSYTSIRRLGRNGNVLWIERDTFKVLGETKTFWCGKDVYKVQLINARGGRSVFTSW